MVVMVTIIQYSTFEPSEARQYALPSVGQVPVIMLSNER